MARQPFEVVTRGFHELETAFADVALKVDAELAAALTALAKPVKDQASTLALDWEPWTGHQEGQARTAAGFRIRRRGLDVVIEQSQRKTTGYHPEYGGIQMRHFLLPALNAHEAEIEAKVILVIDELTGRV